MQIKNRKLFIWLPLLAAWVFDLLFWQKVPGISFAIFVAVVVAVGLFLAYREGVRPASRTLLLLLPTAFFAAMTFIRMEPLTTFLNYALTLLLLAIFANSLVGGAWPFYRAFNYIGVLVTLMIDALTKAMPLLHLKPGADNTENETNPKRARNRAILRGVLFAAPLVLLLTAILASADAIFEARVQVILDFLNLEDIPEYLWRGFLIMVMGYLLAGIYLHAIEKDNDGQIREEGDAAPVMGFIESIVIMGSVNLLFLSFVVIQFRYFFGGNTNIHVDGYTYAEYARRGFGELVATALISLLMLMLLSVFARREGKGQHRLFTGLGTSLVLLVGVMLVSALKRLLLYENAYGFSRVRTYTHVYIYWLGALMLATLLLVVFRQRRFFTLAMFLAALGYGATLNVLNVDAFIVSRNIARATNQDSPYIVEDDGGGCGNCRSMHTWEKFDFQYLGTLSTDALPRLAQLYRQKTAPDERLSAAIACHAFKNEEYDLDSYSYWKDYTWSSYHYSRSQALKEWQSLMDLPDSSDLKVKHEVVDDYTQYYVLIDGEKRDCYSSNWVD